MSLFSQMKTGLSILLGQDVSEMSETELAQAVDDAATASENEATTEVVETVETTEAEDSTNVSELISSLESRIEAQENSIKQLASVVELLTKKVVKGNVSLSTKTSSGTDAVANTVSAINSKVDEAVEKTVKPLNLSEVVGSKFK